MKGQNSNKILPIKSLLENLKNESKKHYLHLDNKNNQPIVPQLSTTPKVKQHYNPPQTHRPHSNQQVPPQQQHNFHQKRSSVGKNIEKNQGGYNGREEMVGYPGYSSAKKDRSNIQFSARYVGTSQQSFSNKIDYLGQRYYMPNKSEQTYFLMKQESKKNPELYPKGLDNNGKESLTLTDKLNSKFEEQTRYMSKFEKLESQPIFKDQITKIKTQLFHKQALLFQKTQQLEEKEKKVHSLQMLIESNFNQSNREKYSIKENQLKQANLQLIKRSQNIQLKLQNSHKINSELQQIIKQQKDTIEELKEELQEKQEQHRRYCEQNDTNYKLFNLKVRQYEAEDRQRNHEILEIKQKQRKHHDSQQKMINGLNELLRQKQQILQQAYSISANKQKEIDALRNSAKSEGSGIFKQLEDKQAFIRQLSAEVGDLKINMRNLQLRITQMIQEQQQLKKSLSERENDLILCKNHFDGIVKDLQRKMVQMKQEKDDASQKLLLKIKECEVLHLTIENQLLQQNKQISQLKIEKRDLEFSLENKIKEIDEQKDIFINFKKDNEQLINNFKKESLELSQNMKKRQSIFAIIQEKNNQLEEKIRKYQSSSRLTPPKNVPAPTAKLIKDNQRLNSIIKGLDIRLHQTIKLNSSLNEQITIKQLQTINNNLSKRFKEDLI